MTGPQYRTLPTARLSFGGDKLELRQGDQRRYAALVDIKDTPTRQARHPERAAVRGQRFIETQSFSILPRREAMRALELQRDQLIASDDVVASQVAEMDVALNELGDGQFCMGEYHYSLVVFGDDVADAGRRAAIGHRRRRQRVQPADVPGGPRGRCRLVRADAGQLAVAARDAKLSSRAFAALSSGHNFARGKRDGNPWGEAWLCCARPRPALLHLNLHSSPDGEDSADKSCRATR